MFFLFKKKKSDVGRPHVSNPWILLHTQPSTFTLSARASAVRASAASAKTFAFGGLSLAAGVVAFAAVAQPEARPAMCAAAPSAERTYIMIKPDGVQRALIADIISRFEKRGYKLVGLKIRQPSKELLEVRGPRADGTRDGVKHAHALADVTFILADRTGSIRSTTLTSRENPSSPASSST